MTARIVTEGLGPMQKGRLDTALDRRHNRNGEIATLRAFIERGEGVKSETDGMIDYNRTKFNRMNGSQQREYEARLKAKRYYLVDGWIVPKIVFDAVRI